MRTRTVQTIALLIAMACSMFAASGVGVAEQVRWPAWTSLPRPAPIPAPQPQVLERAPAVAAYLELVERERENSPKCDGVNCVVCIAACTGGGAQVVHSMKPRQLGVLYPAPTRSYRDGNAAGPQPFAGQQAGGIVCGSEGGCRVTAIAPPREHTSHITVVIERRRSAN